MQSDQSLQGSQWVAKDQKGLQVDREHSDQPVWMLRLISVFAGSTCNLVEIAVPQLIYNITPDTAHI